MPESVNTSILDFSRKNPFHSDDQRETMVKVDHVSMVFNMASEQLNNLKEYAIKLVKRELFFEGFTALNDVSFEVKKGDVFGIMGTNGSGKSTMLKIVAGVLEPTKGSCTIRGSIAPLIELGAGFDLDLTARENIYLNGALLGYSKTFIDDHFDEIVAFAEVERFLDMPMKNYSSGMVARIAFAIATVIIPDILLVDEVLSVGDFMFQRKCEDRISELIEKHGVTVLIVSHSNAQIARLCNKAIWIEKGHTRMLGDAAEVCRVYGSLGGRTGSKEAERRILSNMSRMSEVEDLLQRCVVIEGESANNTNAKVVMRGWENERPSTVVLACDITHANAVIGNALASAYDAPILTTKPDYLSDVVVGYLLDNKPERLILLDCGDNASQAFASLKSLSWNPEVVSFCDKLDVFDYSCKVFDYGCAHNLWGNEVAIIGFDDNLLSLIAAPYLYANRVPVIMFRDGDAVSEMLVKSVHRSMCQQVLGFGQLVVPYIDSFKEAIGPNSKSKTRLVTSRESEDACMATTKFVLDSYGSLSGELCVGSATMTQWPELLSCGGYAAKRNTAIMLVDKTSLDGVAMCLDFIQEYKQVLSTLVYVGRSGLDPLERELMCCELLDE